MQTVLTLIGILAIAHVSPISGNVENSLTARDVIGNLPEAADQIELDFQPFLDFDMDGCYHTSAIDKDGNFMSRPIQAMTPQGPPQGDCRDQRQLDSSNAYSRKRCNNGYCAIMYEYYFEKDQRNPHSFLNGHKHEWENIVVFVKGDQIVRVSPSGHAGYPNPKADGFPTDGKHPLMVYHKEGPGTHNFRFANDDDVAKPENPTWRFFRAPLVGWDHWPNVDLRNKLIETWPSGINPKFAGEFEKKLREAAGDGVPGFDPALDA